MENQPLRGWTLAVLIFLGAHSTGFGHQRPIFELRYILWAKAQLGIAPKIPGLKAEAIDLSRVAPAPCGPAVFAEIVLEPPATRVGYYGGEQWFTIICAE